MPDNLHCDDYDAIVIGSGMGALAFSSIMAKLKGWRVLVLERHFKIGGFTHTFSRPGGWTWDVGLHYVGGMGSGMLGRRLFDFVTDRGVEWNPMPDAYDRFVYPGLTFAVPTGEANFRKRLTHDFPKERANIEHYFRDLKSVMAWFTRYSIAGALPPLIGKMLRSVNRLTGRLPLSTTKAYLDKRFQDPQLRAVVASQWGDHGLPPSQCAFVTHALIATHYFDGAWYPEGGAGGIARTAGAVIRHAGGDLLPNHEVTRILLEGDRAVGVEVHIQKGKNGASKEFRAPLVVSDAGAWNTFSRLLPESFPLPFREELAVLPETAEVVELFLGLRGDPRQLGFQGENHWIFTSFDHDEMYQRRNELADGRAAWAYLSFPSLKNSSETSKTRGHTAEIVAPLAHRVFEAFRGQPWHHRAPDYACAKQRITDALLGLIEQHHAGFRALVEYAELATPLTFEHFTAAPRGSIYGYPGIPERYRKSWLGVDTPVRNLYLTGADASSPGIMGALMGGVATASRLLGPLGFLKAMSAAYSDTTRSSGRPYTNPDTSVETAR